MMRAVMRRGSGFGMMVLEVAFGLAVVAQCLAFVSWFVGHAEVDPGFPDQQIVLVDLTSTSTLAAGPPRRADHERDRLRALPGVVAVAQVEQPPLMLPEPYMHVSTASGARATAWAVRGSPGIEAALGLRLLAGRAPTEADLGAPRGVLVTASLAHALLPDADPVGAVVTLEADEPVRIVGVVADVNTSSGMAPVRTQALIRPQALAAPWRTTRWLVRFEGPPLAPAALTEALAPLGVDVEAATLAERRTSLDRALYAGQVVLLVVVDVVASVTLLGSLGMAAFLVHARRRQVAIMRAVGATRADVARYFLIENVLVTTLGVLLGVVLTFVLHAIAIRFEPTLGLSPRDIGLGAVLFWVVGLLAAWSPAAAASRIAPGAKR